MWVLNSPAIEKQQQLTSFLSSRFGADAAALFAVPKRENDASITWTDPLGATSTRSLSELSGEEKERAGSALRQVLQNIETACDDSLDGQLLLGALNVESADAIRVTAEGRPILAGWGAIPAALATPEQLASHHLATLGPFLSRVTAPQFWISAIETRPLHGTLYGLRALIAAVVLAAIVLAWLLLPGVLRNTSDTSPIDLSGPNKSIERQIDTVRRSLESNVCIATVRPHLETPLGQDEVVPRSGGAGQPATPLPGAAPSPGATGPSTRGPIAPSPGSGPSSPATPPSGQPAPDASPGGTSDRSDSSSDRRPGQDPSMSQPTPPVDPNTAPVPPQVSQGSDGTLSTLLKKSTVLIVTKTGLGSGFFVSRDHILTNRHVTENSDWYRVGNKTMPELVQADLVGTTESSRIGEPDFALLKLRSGSSEAFLSFADALPFELENVIAAGYPGFIISGDESYRRLKNGDFRSIPEIALTSGAVTYIQNSASQSPIVLHYATISPGNSGGPLTDQCGRVVGINTFVSSTDGPNARMNYSLAASSAIRFLKRFNITPTVVAGNCTTAGPGTPPTAQNPSAQSPPVASNPPSKNAPVDPGAKKSSPLTSTEKATK